MSKSKPKILIISSANPTIGPGVLALDYYNAYKKSGYDVDLLTLHRNKKHPDLLYVYDTPSKFNRCLRKIFYNLPNKIIRLLNKLLGANNDPIGSYTFFYRKEEDPPVPSDDVLKVIKKQYDLVHILFWQGMLSFSTVREIYRQQGCSFYFDCIDYSPVAGGCHFMGDCQRYKTGCGCCPAFKSNNPYDFTWHNVKYRKEVYNEIKPIVSGNSYMLEFYKQSELLKNQKMIQVAPIIDLNFFKPFPKEKFRKKMSLSEEKTFVILFGCQHINDERKGVTYLIDAIDKFLSMLSREERNVVLIMAMGNDFFKIKHHFSEIDCLDLGYVNKEELPAIYSYADVFLCSSINDAGPMMVNQSLCCGTPVVGFEMGACLDAVKGKNTGYCAKLKDTNDFAKGIQYIYHLTPEEKMKLSKRCVEFAQLTYSYETAVNRVIGAFSLFHD